MEDVIYIVEMAVALRGTTRWIETERFAGVEDAMRAVKSKRGGGWRVIKQQLLFEREPEQEPRRRRRTNQPTGADPDATG